MVAIVNLSSAGDKVCILGNSIPNIIGISIIGANTAVAAGDVLVSKGYFKDKIEFTADIVNGKLTNYGIDIVPFIRVGKIIIQNESYIILSVDNGEVTLFGPNGKTPADGLGAYIVMFCESLRSIIQVISEEPLALGINGDPLTIDKDQSLVYDNLSPEEVLCFSLSVDKSVMFSITEDKLAGLLVVK